ncbi:MAG TPA: TonB-dependent receptor [Vicinamibacterales bacterium]|nr:TonB-dependent receptor [Vicinamibacterales bacterium]
MHSSASRLRWLAAAACRCAALTILFAGAASSRAAAADTVAGTVVDQSGQPLPRAYVRAVAPSGVELTSTFTDDRGRFALRGADACQLQVSMTGFEPAAAACTSSQPVRIVLHVAPIQETVVVSATRTAVPADQVGASVTAFTAADLDRRRTPLVADLLRSTPGVMVIQSGGVGGVTSLFVRGGESNYNKVLLDGIPLNEPGGTFNFSNLTTDNIERVEIVRGAQSALFGSDAMSSVVQLFTKRPDRAEARPHVTASVEGGTYGTVRGGAAVSGASQRFDYSFGASGYATDNNTPNDHFTNTTLSANAGVVLSDTATLRFIGRGELEHVGTPGQTAFGRPDLDAFFQRHDGVGGITFDQQVNASFRQRASYALSVSHQRSADLITDPAYTPQFGDRIAPFEFSDFTFDSRTNLRRHHASYQADWRLTTDASTHGDQRLTLLGDWDGERATLDDALGGTSTPASRNNFGASIQHQALWARTFVTLSGRVEHNDSFGTAFVPRGSVVYIAHPAGGAFGETRLKASAGLGIKEPTVLQSFSLSPFFLGNPNLQPERARTLDAGIEQRLLGDRAKIEVTWFDNRYRNIIATRTTDPDTFSAQYFNIGLTQARGAEIGAELVAVRTVHVRGGYTFVASEILESTSPLDPVFQPGQWAFRRPRHSGYLGVAWGWSRLTADVTGVIVGRFVDSDFSSLEPPLVSNPGYATWNARFSYDATAQLRVLLSIDNLANAEYMEPLGYPALGRAVRLGLRVGF